MAYLMRTFSGLQRGAQTGGESVTEVNVPPIVLPIVELCLPLSDLLPSGGTAGGGGMQYGSIGTSPTPSSVAAGAGLASTTALTLGRGVWRISGQIANTTIGATNGADVAARATLTDAAVTGFIDLALVPGFASPNVPQLTYWDVLVHLSIDGFSIRIATSDPVTALAISKTYSRVYACRIL